jgi:hypothetical protein
MGYDEARFIGRFEVSPPTLPAVSQVFTASGHVVTTTHTAPNLIPVGDAVIVLGGAAQVDVVGTSQGYVVNLQNGTAVLATASAVNTAGSAAAFTQVSTASVAAAGALTISVTGTGTASATQTTPVLRLNISLRGQFV